MCLHAGSLQRGDLGVRTSKPRRPASADHVSILDDYSAKQWIQVGAALHPIVCEE